MSHLLELIGFGLLAAAAHTLFGTGAAEAVGGISLLVVAQGVDDGAVSALVRRFVRRSKPEQA